LIYNQKFTLVDWTDEVWGAGEKIGELLWGFRVRGHWALSILSMVTGVPGPSSAKEPFSGKMIQKERAKDVSVFAHAYRHYRQIRQSRIS
jgi:hypothetical protein